MFSTCVYTCMCTLQICEYKYYVYVYIYVLKGMCSFLNLQRFSTSTLFLFCTPKISWIVYLILGHISLGFKPPFAMFIHSIQGICIISFVNLLLMKLYRLAIKNMLAPWTLLSGYSISNPTIYVLNKMRQMYFTVNKPLHVRTRPKQPSCDSMAILEGVKSI